MTRVLVGAQSFGFGPASKAETISRRLEREGVLVDFVGDTQARGFSAEQDLYERVIDSDELSSLELSAYDALVSVMEPTVTLAGVLAARPVAYVDSLYGFWDWPDPSRYVELSTRLLEDGFESAIARLDRLAPHERQWFGHRFATGSYVQALDDAVVRDAAAYGLDDPILVNPIVDVPEARGPEGRVLVNLCGLVSPVVSRSLASRYVDLVDRIVAPMAARHPELSFEEVGNPIVLDALERGFWSARRSLPKDRYLSALAGSNALLVPPSLTSVLEARSVGIPVFLLPEQHDGHRPNYDGPLRAAYPSALLSDAYPHVTRVTEAAVPELYAVIDRVLSSEGGFIDDATERIERFIEESEAGSWARRPIVSASGADRIVSDLLRMLR